MSLQDILKEKQDESTTNADEQKDTKRTGTVYTGLHGIFDKYVRRIPRIGDEYFPVDEVQVAALEEQVERGIVTKTVFE